MKAVILWFCTCVGQDHQSFQSKSQNSNSGISGARKSLKIKQIDNEANIIHLRDFKFCFQSQKDVISSLKEEVERRNTSDKWSFEMWLYLQSQKHASDELADKWWIGTGFLAVITRTCDIKFKWMNFSEGAHQTNDDLISDLVCLPQKIYYQGQIKRLTEELLLTCADLTSDAVCNHKKM